MPENQLNSNILLIFLWLFLVTTALLCRPLMPIDETRYVSVAWEMWQSKSFLVPHLSGVPYSHKPPLFFYLIHLGWFIFGVNEWSARLTGPFFGLLNLFLAAHLARRLWPTERQISRIAPFVLLAMPLWTVMTTLTMFDLLLTFFTLLGAEGFLLAGRGKRLTGWGLVAIAIGGGLLAKGLLAKGGCPPCHCTAGIAGPLVGKRQRHPFLALVCRFVNKFFNRRHHRPCLGNSGSKSRRPRICSSYFMGTNSWTGGEIICSLPPVLVVSAHNSRCNSALGGPTPAATKAPGCQAGYGNQILPELEHPDIPAPLPGQWQTNPLSHPSVAAGGPADHQTDGFR